MHVYDCIVLCAVSLSLPSSELSDDSHIYADPSAYEDLSRSVRDSVPRLDPALITIDTVMARSTYLQRQGRRSLWDRGDMYPPPNIYEGETLRPPDLLPRLRHGPRWETSVPQTSSLHFCPLPILLQDRRPCPASLEYLLSLVSRRSDFAFLEGVFD